MLKKLFSNIKNVVLGVFAFGATAASAAVTMNESGVVSGSFDMAPVYSIASIIFGAVASIVVVKWVIAFLKRA